MPKLNAVSTAELYKHLADPNYEHNFSIRKMKDPNGADTVLITEEKSGLLDVVASWIWYSVDSDEVLETMTQLVSLIKRDLRGLETGAFGCTPKAVAESLSRKADEVLPYIDPAKVDAVTKLFEEANSLLNDADYRKDVEWYSKNLKNPNIPGQMTTEYTRLGWIDFYNAFSRTGWLRGFADRIHVIEKDGYEIYTSPRKSYWEQAWPSTDIVEPAARKQATMATLAKMVAGHYDFIVTQQFNVQGMIKNLKGIEGRITNHTNSVQANAIRGQIGKAISTLEKAEKEIRRNIDNSFFRGRILNPILNMTVRPLYYYTVEAPLNAASDAVNYAYSSTVGAAFNAVAGAYKDVKNGIEKVLKA
ncbi:MAG: hypothetical protein JSS30_06675 [Verrucomicrobia bacterium]|nr:hypothetical protein [Verrucomicrobiota bacterium]